ncbi:MAG TPA: DNA N-6-adenine-methyltransferase [Gemmatimonadales bacterium]|nr:DNA N-6-adenine-methyltransferase [Gemmatimonadales bacterium]
MPTPTNHPKSARPTTLKRPYMPASATDDWATPQDLFNRYDAKHHFTLDAAASSANAKCRRYFTKANDGLAQNWGQETVWVNPRYGRVLAAWVQKAFEASQRGATVVLLLPARTCTRWFHEYALRGDVEFLKGRVKFGGASTAAPFPSMVVTFWPASSPKGIAQAAAWNARQAVGQRAA